MQEASYRLQPLLKWAGGKEQELRHIHPLLPSFARYYEPFVGGGAVFFSIQAERSFINDRSSELVHFYRMVAESNPDFFHALIILMNSWQNISMLVDAHAIALTSLYKTYSCDQCSLYALNDALFERLCVQMGEIKNLFSTILVNNPENYMQETRKNMLSKTRRMKELEHKKGKLSEKDILANIESALKSAFYMHLRHLYNRTEAYHLSPALAAAIFFFVRENAYAAMFRYNSLREMNVPYGGISYNRKDIGRKIRAMQSPLLRRYLSNTVIENMDFEAFLHTYPPREDDFVFLDPPYDSEFSTYTQNEFGRQDQERLAQYLFNECQAMFMLVIKNTETIQSLYHNRGLQIRAFNKKYLVSFQDRNDRDAEHLIITNY